MMCQTPNRKTLRLNLVYFAQLRELAGRMEESCITAHQTIGPVYEELRARYQFPFEQSQLRVAINEAFATWETPLSEGDNIVFIPPVTGG